MFWDFAIKTLLNFFHFTSRTQMGRRRETRLSIKALISGPLLSARFDLAPLLTFKNLSPKTDCRIHCFPGNRRFDYNNSERVRQGFSARGPTGRQATNDSFDAAEGPVLA